MKAGRDAVLTATVCVCVAATLLQAAFWARQGVGGDQAAILRMGREYAEGGVLRPSAKGTSGGGRVPGILMQLCVGAPLRLWGDPRAPGLPLVAANALALVVVTVGMRRPAGGGGGLAAAAL